jgi:predicted ArsR family transcriptional regulator
MTEDAIAKEFSWLDRIITNPENLALFEDEKLLTIVNALSSRWKKENRLSLLNELSAAYGQDSLLLVIDRLIDTNCRKDWRQNGKLGDNSLQRFITLLWEPLAKSGFEYTSKQEGNITSFCVTRCPVADLAKNNDGEKWMYHLICLTDEPSVTGFNKNIHFSRTKTIMQGHAVCDHTYKDLTK